jgi:fido (protein-threonine AMPylation protein)
MAAWKAIPGETPIDPSGLRDKGIRTRKQLNEAEARNIAAAVYKYLIGPLTPAMSPFDLAWTLKLHEEMFGKVWEWAGQPRKIDLNLGVPWHQVETRLYDLLQTLPYWKNMPLMEQAARVHHGAVAIHPFANGNGRWSRMLANIWLKLHGSPLTVWPEESVADVSVILDEYLNAVKAADTMDFAPLTALHERFAVIQEE